MENKSAKGGNKGKKPLAAAEPKFKNAGVALSGGGMRSAYFQTGAMYTLADSKILPLDSFKYMSCVSGGSYLGTALFATAAANSEKLPKNKDQYEIDDPAIRRPTEPCLLPPSSAEGTPQSIS